MYSHKVDLHFIWSSLLSVGFNMLAQLHQCALSYFNSNCHEVTKITSWKNNSLHDNAKKKSSWNYVRTRWRVTICVSGCRKYFWAHFLNLWLLENEMKLTSRSAPCTTDQSAITSAIKRRTWFVAPTGEPTWTNAICKWNTASKKINIFAKIAFWEKLADHITIT